MSNSYIKFEIKDSETVNQKKQTLKQFVKTILVKILPEANPDFDEKIDDVKTWLIECGDEDGIPLREIGLDNSGEVIVKMPYKNNVGYWVDNNLYLKDFAEHFQVQNISKDFFQEKWQLFT